jgi:hypothetical protein
MWVIETASGRLTSVLRNYCRKSGLASTCSDSPVRLFPPWTGKRERSMPQSRGLAAGVTRAVRRRDPGVLASAEQVDLHRFRERNDGVKSLVVGMMENDRKKVRYSRQFACRPSLTRIQ